MIILEVINQRVKQSPGGVSHIQNMDKYNNNNNNKLAKTNWKMWVPGIKGGGGENVYVVVGKKSLSCVVVVLKFKHMQRIKTTLPKSYCCQPMANLRILLQIKKKIGQSKNI